MKLTTPQIVWHSKEPVFSADFHHSGEPWRLATGGADKDVKIWKVVRGEEGKATIVFMASLARHSGAINVVRFSPNGELLASAGDDNVVCLWRMGEGGGASGNISTDTTLLNKETWNVTKMLRGHVEDIYDACWSSSSSLLVTGSVDNTAIIWDVSKGQALCKLADSKQYVQGVAWDPIGHYLATLSNDRHLRIYAGDQKFKCVQSVSKMTAPEKENGGGGGGSSKQFRMWIDESLSFFFRRLTFSPDGNLLVVPAGRFETGEKVTNMTYIFTKSNLSKPAVCLPCPEKATVVVKFCPKIFKLRDSIEKDKSLFSLPYRMVYAVASLDAVLLYDTQQAQPFAYLSNIHYSGITDLAWSEDGLVLVITSSDAYCSIVTFDPGELGVAMATEDLPDSMKKSKMKKDGVTSAIDRGRDSTPHSERKMNKKKAANDSNEKRSPTAAESETDRATEAGGDGDGGGGKEAKGKRRVMTTLVESFPSPSPTPPPEKTHPQPTPSPTSPRQPAKEETGSTGSTSSAAAAGEDTGSSNSAEKKPRRINFETLSLTSESSYPPSSPPQQGSCDPESKSRDPSSTHSLNIIDKTPSNGVEPMNVQTVE